MVQNAKTLKRVENKRMAWGVINSKLNPSLVLFNSVVACISSFCWVVLCLRLPWGNQIRLEREEKHNTKNIRTEQTRKKTHSERWRRRPTTMSRERRKLKEIRECKKKESLQRESSWNCEFRINSYIFFQLTRESFENGNFFFPTADLVDRSTILSLFCCSFIQFFYFFLYSLFSDK